MCCSWILPFCMCGFVQDLAWLIPARPALGVAWAPPLHRGKLLAGRAEGSAWRSSFPTGDLDVSIWRQGFSLPLSSSSDASSVGKHCCQILLQQTAWLFSPNWDIGCFMGKGGSFNKSNSQLAHRADTSRPECKVCWDKGVSGCSIIFRNSWNKGCSQGWMVYVVLWKADQFSSNCKHIWFNLIVPFLYLELSKFGFFWLVFDQDGK